MGVVSIELDEVISVLLGEYADLISEIPSTMNDPPRIHRRDRERVSTPITHAVLVGDEVREPLKDI